MLADGRSQVTISPCRTKLGMAPKHTTCPLTSSALLGAAVGGPNVLCLRRARVGPRVPHTPTRKLLLTEPPELPLKPCQPSPEANWGVTLMCGHQVGGTSREAPAMVVVWTDAVGVGATLAWYVPELGHPLWVGFWWSFRKQIKIPGGSVKPGCTVV